MPANEIHDDVAFQFDKIVGLDLDGGSNECELEKIVKQLFLKHLIGVNGFDPMSILPVKLR
jgi:hypothetical protein